MGRARVKVENEIRAPHHLHRVKALWRANRATLGFFPDGAFREYASRRWILIAVDPIVNDVVGYLLYRISNQRATIVHLCVDGAYRGQGVARLLVERLVERTRDLCGIGLRCRRDYSATGMWPRFGFVALKDAPGRGHDGGELTYWWRSHGHPTLFSGLSPAFEPDRLQVVIDANVFIDIFDPSQQTPEAEESRSLQADWLSEVDLYITDELLNEINRIPDSGRRQETRRWAHRLPRVDCGHLEYERVLAELCSLFPPDLSDTDESDLRHLSRAIAAQAPFFVTRDAKLLRMADDLHARYQVFVVRPADLVIHMDEMLRAPEYQPSRLAGTLLKTGRVVSGAGDDLVNAFHMPTSGESRTQFARRLRSYLASPRRYECSVVTGEGGTLLGLTVIGLTGSTGFEVLILRVARGPTGATLARHLAFSVVSRASQLGRSVVRVADMFMAHDVQEALRAEGFTPGPAGWIKLTLCEICTHSELLARLSGVIGHVPSEYADLHGLPSALARLDAAHDLQALAQAERLLWPLKVADAGLPSFLVPIKPAWAQHLFDEALAHRTLFGAETELALRRECVYYRAKRPTCGLAVPGRILWYVSRGKGIDGTSAVRACSSLDEVLIGSASEMFKRYRRYGVYGWPEVSDLVKGDGDREIMVLRFSGTELFPSPVCWGPELKAMLGRGTAPQSPARVSPEAFARICAIGRRPATEGK